MDAGGASDSGKQGQDGQQNAHLFVFTNDKAGMTSVDKKRTNQVIYDMSKNSRYFQHAQKNDGKTSKRIDALQAKVKSIIRESRIPLNQRKNPNIDRQVFFAIQQLMSDLSNSRIINSSCLTITTTARINCLNDTCRLQRSNDLAIYLEYLLW